MVRSLRIERVRRIRLTISSNDQRELEYEDHLHRQLFERLVSSLLTITRSSSRTFLVKICNFGLEERSLLSDMVDFESPDPFYNQNQIGS